MADGGGTSSRKSRKRKYLQAKGGNRKRRRVANWDVNLTKDHRILLCTCEQGMEGLCQRQLTAAFTELVDEFLKADPDLAARSAAEEERLKKAHAQQQQPRPAPAQQPATSEGADPPAAAPDATSATTTADAAPTATAAATAPATAPATAEEAERKEEGPAQDAAEAAECANPGVVDIAASVAREVAAKVDNPTVQWIRAPGGQVILLLRKPLVDPVALTIKAFEDAHPEVPELSTYLHRIIPLQRTCFARNDDIKHLAADMMPKAFEGVPKEHSFAIVFKRNNKQVNRDQAIKDIAEAVPDGYKVDLSNPMVVIVLKTFALNVAGLAVVKGGAYKKFPEFHIRKMRGELEP